MFKVFVIPIAFLLEVSLFSFFCFFLCVFFRVLKCQQHDLRL